MLSLHDTASGDNYLDTHRTCSYRWLRWSSAPGRRGSCPSKREAPTASEDHNYDRPSMTATPDFAITLFTAKAHLAKIARSR